MARRIGLRSVPLHAVEAQLRRERAGNRDVYAPLTNLAITVSDPLSPPHGRFRLRGRIGGREEVLDLTPTALSQLCNVTGVPMPFVERAPASLAASSLRCFAEMVAEGAGKTSLLRLKGQGTSSSRLRAILPQSYVRLDDRAVLAEVTAAVGGADLRAATVNVEEDVFAVRLVFDEELNLGSARHPDGGRLGIDVITSETGRHPLEVRWVVFRTVCSNGMTQVSSQQEALRKRYTRVDRESLRSILRSTVEEALSKGRGYAERLADTRSDDVADPVAEVDRIFRHHRLGNPRGKVGRWVTDHLLRARTLWGVPRFEVVQAFTQVAQSLDHAERRRFEDAMGSYVGGGERG